MIIRLKFHSQSITGITKYTHIISPIIRKFFDVNMYLWKMKIRKCQFWLHVDSTQKKLPLFWFFEFKGYENHPHLHSNFYPSNVLVDKVVNQLIVTFLKICIKIVFQTQRLSVRNILKHFFLIFALYLLLENYIPVRQVLKGRFKIFILDSYSNHCQLHSMVDADDGVLHAMNQEQGRVAFDKLCLLQKACSLVCPQGLGIISWSKIFAGLELVWRKMLEMIFGWSIFSYHDVATLGLETWGRHRRIFALHPPGWSTSWEPGTLRSSDRRHWSSSRQLDRWTWWIFRDYWWSTLRCKCSVLPYGF